MIIPQTPNSAEERKRVPRLENRLITLRDGGGRVVALHDPRPEQDDLEIAS
jgi:hypothetical protein